MYGHRLVTLPLTINGTLKWFSSLPVLRQKSFWGWRCSFRFNLCCIADLCSYYLLHHLFTGHRDLPKKKEGNQQPTKPDAHEHRLRLESRDLPTLYFKAQHHCLFCFLCSCVCYSGGRFICLRDKIWQTAFSKASRVLAWRGVKKTREWK